VPDYADGIDRTLGGANPVNNKAPTGGQFTLVQLQLPTLIDPAVATIEFDYPVANPNSITKASGPGSGPYDYAPGSGTMTLWTNGIVDGVGSYARQPDSVASAIMPGHFIPDSTEFVVNRLGAAAGSRISLWLEGISPSASAGASSIVVLLDPDGPGPLPDVIDTVRLTVFDVDVSIDSDNTAGLRGGPNGPNPHEDNVEELNNAAGKQIPLNHGDRDSDGVKDYWDGYSVPGWNQLAANASASFTPIQVTIPAPVNLSTAMIRIDYPVNDPSLSGLEDIRIWTKDGAVARDGRGVDAGGDWVRSIYYAPAQFGFSGTNRTVTLYVEGIGRSAATEYITVSLNPDNTLTAPDEASDRAGFYTFSRGIEGQIRYDPATPKPVRGAAVVLFDGNDPPQGNLLAQTRTDDQGYFFLEIDENLLPNANLQVEVRADSGPTGTQPGQPLRGVFVTPLTSGGSYAFDVTTLVTWPTAASPVTSVGMPVIGTPGGAHTDAEQAFWVFDAAITASRFHARLPGATAGQSRLVYPAPASEYWPSTDAIHIGDNADGDDYDAWDVIVHEYGHHVADLFGLDGTYSVSPDNYHSSGFNLRSYKTGSIHDLDRLAYSEGFASFYSVLAQTVEGVSTPPVTSVSNPSDVAGDYNLYSRSVEATTPAAMGEDDERSTTRVLWDLYDPANELGDTVEMGYTELFTYLSANDVDSLSNLWHSFETSLYGTDNRALAERGRLFQQHNVAALISGTTIGGTSGHDWHPGDATPVFEWDVQVSSPAAPGETPTTPAGSRIFNRFGVKVFDDSFNVIYSSDLVETVDFNFVPLTNRAQWTPSGLDWSTISATPGQKYWIIYAGYQDPDTEPTTGLYWSETRDLTIHP
jgi:hypothetical protein